VSEVITIESAELAYEARDHESTQARLSGRLKFACCRRCGSADRMQAVHQNTLAEMTGIELSWLTWYYSTGNDEYLFYPCPLCNPTRIIPTGFELLSLPGVLYWINYDTLMQPDYAALAREEPVSQIKDSRDSAGMEE